MNISRTLQAQQPPRNSQLVGKDHGKGEVTLTFEEPVTDVVLLGGIPKTKRGGPTANQSRVIYDGPPPAHTDKTKPIYDEARPRLKDGQPEFAEVSKTFELGPVSLMDSALKGAAYGGGLAAPIAVGLAYVNSSNAPLAAALTVGSALAGAGIGALTARGKVNELEWVEKPIYTDHLVGHTVTVHESTRYDRDDHTETTTYYHRTNPIIREEHHGKWLEPQVVTRRES